MNVVPVVPPESPAWEWLVSAEPMSPLDEPLGADVVAPTRRTEPLVSKSSFMSLDPPTAVRAIRIVRLLDGRYSAARALTRVVPLTFHPPRHCIIHEPWSRIRR